MKIITFFMVASIACPTHAHITPFIASALPVATMTGYYLNKMHSESANKDDMRLWKAYKKGFACGAIPPVNILLATWVAGTKSSYMLQQLSTHAQCIPLTNDCEATTSYRAKLTGFCAGLSTYLILPFIYRTSLRMNYAYLFKHKYS